MQLDQILDFQLIYKKLLKILMKQNYLIFFAEHIDLLPDFDNPDLNQEIYDKSLIEKYT